MQALHTLGRKLFAPSSADETDEARNDSPMRQFLVKRWQASATRELLNASHLSLQ